MRAESAQASPSWPQWSPNNSTDDFRGAERKNVIEKQRRNPARGVEKCFDYRTAGANRMALPGRIESAVVAFALDESCKIFAEPRETKFSADFCGAPPAHLAAQRLIAQHSFQRGSEFPCVATWNKQTIHAIFDQVGYAACCGSNDGLAKRHRLEKNKAKTFTRARKRENLALRVATGQLFLRKALEKVNRSTSTRSAHQLTQPRHIITRSDKRQMEIGKGRSQLRDRRDQPVRSFITLRGGPPANGKHYVAFGKSSRRAHRFVRFGDAQE